MYFEYSKIKHDDACRTLGLNPDTDTITTDIIRKQYRIYALRYHPDKNRDVDAITRFQEIQEAYEYLIELENKWDSNEKNTYNEILESFLSSIFSRTTDQSIYVKLCSFVLTRISSKCDNMVLEYMEKIDKNMLVKIYEILTLYSESFHVGADFLEKLRKMIIDKSKDDECIILNPFIEDLLIDNLYLLKHDGEDYLVPLWHHEVIFDHRGSDLHVKCFPVLAENMDIDSNNNLLVYLEYNILELWHREKGEVNIGGKVFEFDISQLRLSRYPQQIWLRSCGLSAINDTNLFDVNKRKDIVLVITLV